MDFMYNEPCPYNEQGLYLAFHRIQPFIVFQIEVQL